MLEVLLAALTLAAWYGFLRLLRKGRAVTRPVIVVRFAAAARQMQLAFKAMGLSLARATEAMQEFNRQYAKAQRITRGKA